MTAGRPDEQVFYMADLIGRINRDYAGILESIKKVDFCVIGKIILLPKTSADFLKIQKSAEVLLTYH